MRIIALDRYRGHTIRVLGETVSEHFIGGQSESVEQVYVTIDGQDVTDQTVYISTSDPAQMIVHARGLIDGGMF